MSIQGKGIAKFLDYFSVMLEGREQEEGRTCTVLMLEIFEGSRHDHQCARDCLDMTLRHNEKRPIREIIVSLLESEILRQEDRTYGLSTGTTILIRNPSFIRS